MRSPIRFGRSKGILLFCWLGLLFCALSVTLADDDYDFVKEVLEEGENHYEEHYDEETATGYATYEEKLRQKQEEELLKRHAEEERIVSEKAERIQQQREAAFATELAKMTADQQKAARKQKKKDARIVRQILRAAKSQNHYAVLGLRNWEVLVPPRTIKLISLALRIPGFSLFHICPKDIKKHYRKLAMTVHPDKNRDGRANEAFIAVENAASILTNEKQRTEYDEMVRTMWRERRQQGTKRVAVAFDGTMRVGGRAVRVFRKVLGPFAFPVAVMGSLLV